jgi:hypothetical protein
LVRLILLVISILLSFESIAQTVNPILCNGKYSAAAEMIDAAYGKYGTLYSGGEHWHQVDHVGATIDLYRLWKGLFDLKLRHLEQGINEDQETLKTQIALTEALRLGTEEAREVSEEDRRHAVTTLDLMTTSHQGKPVDWWHNYPPDKDDASGITAALAKQSPLLDWLQFILVASDMPQQQYWHWKNNNNNDPAYKLLADKAWEEYEKSGSIEWFIASFLYVVEPYECDSDACGNQNYASTIVKWKEGVSTCQASEQEYAAFAISYLNAMHIKTDIYFSPGFYQVDEEKIEIKYFYRLPKPIEDLPASVGWNDLNLVPETIQKLVIQNYALRRISERANPYLKNHPYSDPSSVFAFEHSASKTWYELATFYLASSVKELSQLDLNHLDQKAIRALNLVSADNLLFLSHLPNVDANVRYALLQTAFKRNFALNQDQKALELIEAIKTNEPLMTQKKITSILTKPIRADLKLALINLNLDPKGVWLNLPSSQSLDRDIGLDTWFASFEGCDSYFKLPNPVTRAQDDLDAWLLAPYAWGRFRGMHGYSIPILNKLNPLTRPLFFDTPSFESELPFSKLIAWSEIAKLGENNAYVNRISSLVIDWAESSRSSRVMRKLKEAFNMQSDEIPEALHKLVMISKTCPLGEKDGKPIAQTAFELLHHDYPKSEWADKTPYWWEPDEWWVFKKRFDKGAVYALPR